MFSFRKIWLKLLGLDRPLQHCAGHKRHLAKCKKCRRAEKGMAEAEGFYRGTVGELGFSQDMPLINHDDLLYHVASDFHGFDGGSSGGAGASGDF